VKTPAQLTTGSLGVTPAQASGNYDFVTDVPIQGPTDPGIRAADCWWTQNVLPVKKPACVDCNGPIPTWARNPSAWGGGPAEYSGNGYPNGWGKEAVRYHGSRARGFTLGAAGDSTATLTGDQQTWVVNALINLNQQIGQATGSSCRGWLDLSGTISWSAVPGMVQPIEITAATKCFQSWYNANLQGTLRTDGVLDQDTLNSLVRTATAHSVDFPTPFPASSPVVASAPSLVAPSVPDPVPAPVPAPPPEKEGLSMGAKIGIAAAGTFVVGGLVYAIAASASKKSGSGSQK
jgi:hypothetical protein